MQLWCECLSVCLSGGASSPLSPWQHLLWAWSLQIGKNSPISAGINPWASAASAIPAQQQGEHISGGVCVFPPERGGIFLCRFLSVNSDHSLTELITIFQTSLFMHVTYSKCLISGYMLPVILLIKILCKCLVNCWCLMLIFTLDIKGFSYISGACLAGLCRYLPPGWYEGHFISADKSWLEFYIPEVWMDSAESLPIGGFVGLFSLNWVYEGLCGLALVLCQSQQVKDASSCRFHSLSFISCERDEELRQEFLLSARCV